MRVRLTRNELLTITNHSEHGFKTKLRRDQWAMAYGGRDAAARSWYRPEDAVAVHLTSALATIYGADLAAQIVRISSDVIVGAISEADTDPEAGALFAVVDFVHTDGRRAYLTCGGRDERPEANGVQFAARGYHVERVISVNVSLILQSVRTGAQRIGIDLSEPFLPAPDSAAFAELLAPYAELECGMVELRAIKKRDAIASKIGARVRARAMGQGTVGPKMRSRSMRAAA